MALDQRKKHLFTQSNVCLLLSNLLFIFIQFVYYGSYHIKWRVCCVCEIMIQLKLKTIKQFDKYLSPVVDWINSQSLYNSGIKQLYGLLAVKYEDVICLWKEEQL